jgi:fatty-acyl-CoA synthase
MSATQRHSTATDQVADPSTFDTAEFAEYLAGQADLGAKGVRRFLRLSKNLPVTGSNKVLKRELQQQRWHTDEPMYRWVGRGTPVYRVMGDDDKQSLDAELAWYGRQRYA